MEELGLPELKLIVGGIRYRLEERQDLAAFLICNLVNMRMGLGMGKKGQRPKRIRAADLLGRGPAVRNHPEYDYRPTKDDSLAQAQLRAQSIEARYKAARERKEQAKLKGKPNGR